MQPEQSHVTESLESPAGNGTDNFSVFNCSAETTRYTLSPYKALLRYLEDDKGNLRMGRTLMAVGWNTVLREVHGLQDLPF